MPRPETRPRRGRSPRERWTKPSAAVFPVWRGGAAALAGMSSPGSAGLLLNRARGDIVQLAAARPDADRRAAFVEAALVEADALARSVSP